MATAFFASHNKFFNLFPPPHFLAAPFAAVACSADGLSAAHFALGTRGFYLRYFAHKKFPPGVIDKGALLDVPKFSEALSALVKECKLDRVHLVLPEEKLYLFTTGVPMLSPAERWDNLEFKIEENVSVSREEVVFDYHLIPEEASHGIRSTRRGDCGGEDAHRAIS